MSSVPIPLIDLTPETLRALAENKLRAAYYDPTTNCVVFVPSREARSAPPGPPPVEVSGVD